MQYAGGRSEMRSPATVGGVPKYPKRALSYLMGGGGGVGNALASGKKISQYDIK